ncbi:hypothetical protein ABZ705_21325 [Streptomyces sp. NPDC006984]
MEVVANVSTLNIDNSVSAIQAKVPLCYVEVAGVEDTPALKFTADA